MSKNLIMRGLIRRFARHGKVCAGFWPRDPRVRFCTKTVGRLTFIEISQLQCYIGAKPSAGAPDRRAAQEDNVLSNLIEAAGSTAARAVPGTARSTDGQSEALLARILSSLDDDKAESVVTIDLRGRSSVADFMVVCSGRSSRQVGAIAEKLTERLKEEFGRTCKIEGKDQGDWVLIDTQDVIVHVFRPEVRDFYQLEKMWMPGASGHLGVMPPSA